MDNHVFYFRDENLDAEKARSGTLKLIVGTDGISMLAQDVEGAVLGLEAIHIAEKKYDEQHVESEIRELFSTNKLLAQSYGSVRAAISVPLATLVPHRLFSDQNCSTYFKLLNPVASDTVFGHEEIRDSGCHLVWGAAPFFRDFIEQYRPCHIGTALISGFQEQASQEGCSLFMNLRGNQAQIAVFDLRSLVFYNSFEFMKPSDLLYFVLLVYDQFKLNPEHTPLKISGALLTDGEHYKMLYRYIQHIRFLKPNTSPNLPNGEGAMPPHFWFDLLCL
jgi:Protein of unknown function (DUF3822)